MRLRAQILIDIEASDFSDAATHQQRVEQLFELVRHTYDQAQLDFRQRRQRTLSRRASNGALVHYTGRMAEYEE
ncbi:MAG: hypothetical protein ABL889_08055 [Terricaulis sp.]